MTSTHISSLYTLFEYIKPHLNKEIKEFTINIWIYILIHFNIYTLIKIAYNIYVCVCVCGVCVCVCVCVCAYIYTFIHTGILTYINTFL